MEATETKFNVNEMQQSAIIYRDASAHFIYVCYHCGSMFYQINKILPHIESHFEVVNVMVNQITEDIKEGDTKEENVDSFVDTLDRIKLEPFDGTFDIGFSESMSVPISENDSLITDDRTKVKQTLETKRNSRNDTEQRKKPRIDRYLCHKCPRVCKIAVELQRHLRTHKDDDLLHIFKCTKCDEYFKNAIGLRVHVLGVHLKDTSLDCTACSSKFQISQNIRFLKHLQLHKGSDKNLTKWLKSRKKACAKYEEVEFCKEARFPCSLCPKTFYIQRNLDAHIQTIHNKLFTNECPECHAVFGSLKLYYAHQLEHKRVGPSITETDEEILLAHLDNLIDQQIEHRVEQRQFSCQLCNVIMEKSYDIREHVRRIHVYKMFQPPLTPKTEYFCDICGKAIKTKSNIMKHLEIHMSNTKKYPCSVCGKTFRIASDRTVHEKRHTGVKPFQCDECGVSFVCRGGLNSHKLRHEDTTHPCKICGKIYKNSLTLRGHMQTHRVDRPFKCTQCPKTFNTKVYLKRHEDTHSDRKHPCRYCASEFNTGDGLRQHYRHRHKDEWAALHPKKNNF